MALADMNRPEYGSRREYTEGVIRLGLLHVWRSVHSGKKISAVLDTETHIFRLTALWDGKTSPGRPGFIREGSVWEQLSYAISDIYDVYKDDETSFESEALAILLPHVIPAIDRDIGNWPWIPEGYCTYLLPESSISGCFAWEPSADPKTVSIHIANACLPDSPFSEPKKRAAELLALVDSIKSVSPETIKLGCDSWLNSFPPFLSLFPESWAANITASRLSSGCNWWGQFMSKTGGLNVKNAEFFRRIGSFPWLSVYCECSLEALVQHIYST